MGEESPSDVDAIKKLSLENERLAKVAVAQIIKSFGELGISYSGLCKKIHEKKIGRVGFRNDLSLLLEGFVRAGMIGVRQEELDVEPVYYWNDSSKQVSDYSHLIY